MSRLYFHQKWNFTLFQVSQTQFSNCALVGCWWQGKLFLFCILAVALGLAASGAYAKKSRGYESRGYEEAPRRQRRPLDQSERSNRDIERSTNQRVEESSPGLFDLASMEANLKTLVKAISAAATGRTSRDQGTYFYLNI